MTRDNAQKAMKWFNKTFGSMNTLIIEGDEWWVAKDVAQVLNYPDPTSAINEYVDKDDILTLTREEVEQVDWLPDEPTIIIKEPGVYELIFNSDCPSADVFKEWVMGNVIQSIKACGAYITPSKLDRFSAHPEEFESIIHQMSQDK